MEKSVDGFINVAKFECAEMCNVCNDKSVWYNNQPDQFLLEEIVNILFLLTIYLSSD